VGRLTDGDCARAASLPSRSTEIFRGGPCVPSAARSDTSIEHVPPRSGAIVMISCAGEVGGGVGIDPDLRMPFSFHLALDCRNCRPKRRATEDFWQFLQFLQAEKFLDLCASAAAGVLRYRFFRDAAIPPSQGDRAIRGSVRHRGRRRRPRDECPLARPPSGLTLSE
jgi:hypothetical protein